MSAPRSRAASGLPPVTASAVVDAAARLTVRSGVDGWTVRQLAAELGVGAPVVYHHVGDRDRVVAAVVGRVLASVPVPDRGLPWREWFTALLTDLRRVALHHPGVARRALAVGPVAPESASAVAAGIEVLVAAGFGDEAVGICRYLVDSALALVSVEDDRNADPGRRVRQAEAVIGSADGEGGLALAGDWLRARGSDPNTLRAYDAEHFRYCLARSLDGAQARLTTLRRHRR
ncbi:TetR family transcriptional regulator [Actinosynnema pretiosum subsp. pretiosum]|uniref:TetR family transcriptional regulator n=1 Tax=Actinosynnema pretiosum subsp. pretiosum TaxID=103721 RepID=A0AA45L7E8_9PSEU|nr:Transcriptional regulator, TetR family [Actinosynnema pretiosum subsp. pretiosum]QUF04550.1 TetR family transcriptional regulator [Actinosynnema pretiosum subsp. pretiosum]